MPTILQDFSSKIQESEGGDGRKGGKEEGRRRKTEKKDKRGNKSNIKIIQFQIPQKLFSKFQ